MSCTGCRPPSARGRTPPSRPAWTGRTSWAFRSVCVFGLTSAWPEANLRHYAFMLEGLRETRASLADRGIQLAVLHAQPRRGSPAPGGGGGARGLRLRVDAPPEEVARQGRARIPLRSPAGRRGRCRPCHRGFPEGRVVGRDAAAEDPAAAGQLPGPSPRAAGSADARLAGNQRCRARSATWEPPSWIRWNWTRAWRPFPAHGGNIAGPRASCPVRGGEASLVCRREE